MAEAVRDQSGAPFVDADHEQSPMLKIGVLASHEGTTLQCILDACAAGRIQGEVVVVISNNETPARFHERKARAFRRIISRR